MVEETALMIDFDCWPLPLRILKKRPSMPLSVGHSTLLLASPRPSMHLSTRLLAVPPWLAPASSQMNPIRTGTMTSTTASWPILPSAISVPTLLTALTLRWSCRCVTFLKKSCSWSWSHSTDIPSYSTGNSRKRWERRCKYSFLTPSFLLWIPTLRRE